MTGPAAAGTRILLGRDDLPPQPRRLRVGALEASFDGAWLRWIRAGDVEVLRAIYGAVRGPAWTTVEPVVSDVAVREAGGRLRVDFTADCRGAGIDFGWHGTIEVAEPGSVTFEMDGIARTDCLVGRVGICILHPDSVAGSDLLAETVHGPVTTRFPAAIEPSLWLTDVVGMRWPAAPGLEAHLVLEGDLFEVEDQRNWTDASFKTFSRPLRLPWPYRLAAGERVCQVARLELTGADRPARRAAVRPRVEVTDAERPMPALGVDLPRDGTRFSTAEREAIRELRLAHLRVVLDLGSDAWRSRLVAASDDAASVGAALEIEALGDVTDGWPDLAAILTQWKAPVARVLVFGRLAYDTSADTLRAARTALRATGIPIGGGSRENFAELNRTSLRLADLDVVAFPIAAQCHASDEASIVETLGGQAATARRAAELAPGRPIAVGPILLRPLGVATGDDAYRPVLADPRQASLFIAGWLVGSVDVLATAGVAAATCFAAVGTAGVMDRNDGAAAHWIGPGALFPAFHVLRALGGADCRRVATVSGESPIVASAVRRGPALTIVVANTGFDRQPVVLAVPALGDRRLVVLDERTATAAARDPRWLDVAASPFPGPLDEVVLDLPGMAVAVVTGVLP